MCIHFLAPPVSEDLLNISINIVTSYQQHLVLKWIGLHSQTKCFCMCVYIYIYMYVHIYIYCSGLIFIVQEDQLRVLYMLNLSYEKHRVSYCRHFG